MAADTRAFGAQLPAKLPGRDTRPLLCGGFGEPPFRRAVKMADGFIFAGSFDKTALPGWLRVKELLAEAGRPLESFGAHLVLQDGRGRGFDVDRSVEVLRQWRDVGGTHASVGTMYRGYETPQAHIDFLAEVKQQFDG